MPFPGTGMWNTYKSKINENDFDKFDSKTPVFSSGDQLEWHKRMIVAVQLKYYRSEEYNKKVRNFECDDNLHLRMKELETMYDLQSIDTGNLLEI